MTLMFYLCKFSSYVTEYSSSQYITAIRHHRDIAWDKWLSTHKTVQDMFLKSHKVIMHFSTMACPKGVFTMSIYDVGQLMFKRYHLTFLKLISRNTIFWRSNKFSKIHVIRSLLGSTCTFSHCFEFQLFPWLLNKVILKSS